MKKALKTLMLALLVVPCAFAFVGCGAKKISQAEFTKTVDAAYKYFNDQTFETSKDVTIVTASEMSSTTVVPATAETGKTTTTMSTKSTTEFRRAGQGDNLVVELKSTNVTTTTTKVEALGQTPASTRVETVTSNSKSTLCKLNDKFYEFNVASQSTTVTVNGQKDDAASSETPESKTYAEISAEDWETTTGENSYMLALVIDQLANYKTPEEGAEDNRLEGTYTKDGKTVTGTFEYYEDLSQMFGGMGAGLVAWAEEETPANNTTIKLTFKDNKVTNIKTSASGTLENTTVSVKGEYKISYSASITAPTSLDGYTDNTAV